MRVDRIDTPAGKFRVFVNGLPAFFEVNQGSYNTYWIGDTALKPLACYEVSLDILPLSKGDKVIFAYEYGSMQSDGGDENTVNIVGEVGNYIVGLGALDTIEFESTITDTNSKYLPYENYGNTKSGFEFNIISNPSDFKENAVQTTIIVSLVWESTEKEYAWDIVSFLTC